MALATVIILGIAEDLLDLTSLPLSPPTTTPTQPSGGQCQAKPSINNSIGLFRVGFSWGEWDGIWGRTHFFNCSLLSVCLRQYWFA